MTMTMTTTMTTMNAADNARMVENYSFLELWNLTAEELQTTPTHTHTPPLAIKTMKAYVLQVPSNGKLSYSPSLYLYTTVITPL